MYEVIVCTIRTGRVQRIRFNDSDAAWRCADGWNAKNSRAKTYLVTVETVAHVSAKPAIGRSLSM